MKKLIMAAAIVCAAAVSHGAATIWNSGTIYDHDGNKVGKLDVTAYCFEITSSQYTDYMKMAAADLSTSLWNTYGGNLSSNQGTKDSTAQGKANITSTAIDIAVSGSKYAAILYVDDRDGEGSEWFMGNVGAIENYSGTGDPTAEILSQNLGGDSTKAATSWQTVPEPTSGLLLLLGMAGLALRRRRA